MGFSVHYSVWVIGVLLMILYLIGLAVYRLFITPLAKFPGPKLAALTYWYEFYYDVIKVGQMTFHIEKLHEEYGPIVRIGPNEVHIKDDDFYANIHAPATTRRTDKPRFTYCGFGTRGAGFATFDHNLHRIRRNALAPSLSKRAIAALQTEIQSRVNKYVERLEEYKARKEPVNLTCGMIALTVDIITEYCFALSFNFIEHPEFKPEWHELNRNYTMAICMSRHFPWLLDIFDNIPRGFMKIIYPGFLPVVDFQDRMRDKVSQVKEDLAVGKKSPSHRTIYHDLHLSNLLPPKELELQRLADEGLVLMSAGTLTTAHVLTSITYYLAKEPSVAQRLRDELRVVMSDYPTMPSLAQLEQLPYLAAVTNEGIRIAVGVSHRTPRVFPDTAIEYGDWVIPPGTTVGSTNAYVLGNPEHFPEPQKFKPERFLEMDRADFNKYFVPFGKGPRSCVGIQLAYAELYLTLATLYRPGGLQFELYETYESDIACTHELFVPFPVSSSKGVRMMVK